MKLLLTLCFLLSHTLAQGPPNAAAPPSPPRSLSSVSSWSSSSSSDSDNPQQPPRSAKLKAKVRGPASLYKHVFRGETHRQETHHVLHGATMKTSARGDLAAFHGRTYPEGAIKMKAKGTGTTLRSSLGDGARGVAITKVNGQIRSFQPQGSMLNTAERSPNGGTVEAKVNINGESSSAMFADNQ